MTANMADVATDYAIEVAGCDDHTFLVLNLTAGQAETITKLAERITRRSQYGCQLRMSIRPAVPADIESDTELEAEVTEAEKEN